ncbi:hypothetical protein GO684_01660 [Wolbachia endosymbiont of Litomosoides brasiliensis]|nr:hypothetical protein [Wolbachia endosymbiont of Litomosoides brasiliensis]NUY39408.1 hypothetical protein [Wolbachia endosymbiont of Litomosoides brasiliensis]
MVLRLKLLDGKVMESVKKVLKEVRNNTYVAKKLNAVIAAKKHGITAVARICCISKTALLKFVREEKLFAPLNFVEKLD